jgi:hypothetical protein
LGVDVVVVSMLLLATSLVGLAAMANAQTYVNADETKMPPIGYQSGAIELQDGETGKFSFSNLDQYTPSDFPTWSGWERMIAIHIFQPTGTNTAAGTQTGTLQTTYSDSSDQIWQHTSDLDLTSTADQRWWCGKLSALDLNIARNLEVSFTADCPNSCTSVTPATFKATAWFYNLAPNWVNGVEGSSTYAMTSTWQPQACSGFNPVWDNTDGTDTNSGNWALDAIFRPYDSEGFTADLEIVTFNDWLIQATPPAIQVYTANNVQAGNAFPALTTWVGRDSASTSLGLYATLNMPLTSSTKVMFCMQSETSYNGLTGGSIWSNNGNREYVNSANTFASWCDIGCYPNADCSSTNVPTGGWDMLDFDINKINGVFTLNNGVYVHALIVGASSSVSAAAVPSMKTAFAFGHLPDAATAFGPSALLGFLALAAATLA